MNLRLVLANIVNILRSISMDRDKSIRNKDIEIFRFLRMQLIKLIAAINRRSRYVLNRSMYASFILCHEEKKIDDGKKTYFIFIISMK